MLVQKGYKGLFRGFFTSLSVKIFKHKTYRTVRSVYSFEFPHPVGIEVISCDFIPTSIAGRVLPLSIITSFDKHHSGYYFSDQKTSYDARWLSWVAKKKRCLITILLKNPSK